MYEEPSNSTFHTMLSIFFTHTTYYMHMLIVVVITLRRLFCFELPQRFVDIKTTIASYMAI